MQVVDGEWRRERPFDVFCRARDRTTDVSWEGAAVGPGLWPRLEGVGVLVVLLQLLGGEESDERSNRKEMKQKQKMEQKQ